ncbi:MAG: YfiR family protein [Nitrospirae bacterium]|nr:YfiR family protein [Nitrospirota bacterium]
MNHESRHLYRYLGAAFSRYARRLLPISSSGLLFHFSLVFCLASFIWALPPQKVSYGGQSTGEEYEVKAVYLYNFLQFIGWPESRNALAKDGAMVIGIVGESPFGEALEELQADLRNNRIKPFKIIYYGPYDEDTYMDNCHLLFVSASEKRNFERIVSSLKGKPVLTVADTENFIASGGMINLVHSKGKIRWVINRSAMDRAGLHPAAQLLSIAAKVVGEP